MLLDGARADERELGVSKWNRVSISIACISTLSLLSDVYRTRREEIVNTGERK